MNLRSIFTSFHFSFSILSVYIAFLRSPLLIGILLLTLSACSATQPNRTKSATFTEIEDLSPLSTKQDSLSHLLRSEAVTWAGTPHVWGGTSRNGIDCSALVQTVFDEQLNVALPRTTALQSRVGERILEHNLRVGDLVFYKIDAGTRHVGIYVGKGEFFHASKSHGVTISSLKEPYWQKRFWQIRRVLDDDIVGTIKNPDKPSAKEQVRW